MSKLLFPLQVLILLVMCLGLQATSQAQGTPYLEVAAAAICKDLFDLETSAGVHRFQIK